MPDFLRQFGENIMGLVPIAALFLALAAITKRHAIFDAWRRCRRESVTNLSIALFDALVILPLVAIPAFWLVNMIGVPDRLTAFWNSMPLALTCVIAVLVGDLIGYWRHRLEHSAVLWSIHATHHSDEAMNWLTLVRMHPGNRFTTVTIDMTLLALSGFPPVAVVLNSLVRHWWGFFIHADLPWTLGWVGRWLISPAAHRVHHARDEQLAGYNFATIVTFWDRIWGTYRDAGDFLDVPTGIQSGSLPFHGEMLRPIVALRDFITNRQSKHRAAIIPPA